MTYSWAQGVAFARSHKQTVRANWNGWCEALMWWMLGGVTGSNTSATVARGKSTIVSMDILAAPPGSFHWWALDGVPEGHVAAGAGGGMCIMASATAAGAGENWGNAIAYIGVQHYNNIMGRRAQYLGWSYDHAGAYFSDAQQLSAGTGGAGSADATTPEGIDMKWITAPNRTWALIGFDGAYGYSNQDIAAIVQTKLPWQNYEHDWQWDTEVREANLRGDAMRALQAKATIEALKSSGLIKASAANVDIAALAKATAGLITAPAIDTKALAAALKAEGSKLDEAQLEQIVARALVDSGDDIARQVVDLTSQRLVS